MGCPNDCSGNGKCVDGVCHCNAGFGGAGCLSKPCMQDAEGRDCSGHGVCDTKVGFCVCDKEWTGKDCSEAAKVDPVALHAKVVSKTLKPVTLPAKTKPEPIVDDEPSTIDPPVSCPNDCSGNGKCNSGGRCECRKGFAGSDCRLIARGATPSA